MSGKGGLPGGLRAWINSPTGPKTTHFWGPAANWGFVVAGLSDGLTREPSTISPNMTSAMALYSAMFMRFAWRVRPGPNWLLFSCHACNFAVQGNQLRRYAAARQVSVSDTHLEEQRDPSKTRVLVVGSGWGAISFLRSLDPTALQSKYEVTLVSPRNAFIYTPLLPGAAVGTVEPRSIADPIRRILKQGNYLEAAVEEIDWRAKTAKCVYQKPFIGSQFAKDRVFDVPYDVLVVAIGAVTNTFGVPGVEENCFFLKEMPDAKRLRQRINECFEIASLPNTSPEERRQLLTFVIVGGGPTGVELAAEIHDLIEEDMLKYFPYLKGHASVKLIDTHDHILSAFDRQIGAYATQHFTRSGIDLVLGCRVDKVEPGAVVVSREGTEGHERVAFGTCIWTTGNKMHPVARKLAATLPSGDQEHRRALKTNTLLQVAGTGGSMYALGDVSTVSQAHVLDHAAELFEEGDVNRDGVLSCKEVVAIMRKASSQYPQLAEHAARLKCAPSGELASFLKDVVGRRSAASYDNVIATSTWIHAEEEEQQQPPPEQQEALKGGSKELSMTLEEFKGSLAAIDKQVRPFPATAQVATQQGKFLGQLFNAHNVDPSKGGVPAGADGFRYRHMGMLAYIGQDKGVADFGRPLTTGEIGPLQGWLMGFTWKSFETWQQNSLKCKWCVLRDRVSRNIFGRDISDV